MQVDVLRSAMAREGETTKEKKRRGAAAALGSRAPPPPPPDRTPCAGFLFQKVLSSLLRDK